MSSSEILAPRTFLPPFRPILGTRSPAYRIAESRHVTDMAAIFTVCLCTANSGLGLITERVREDLQTLRRIRNVFAHSAREVDFSHPEVTAVCQFYCVDYVDEEPAVDRGSWTPGLKFSWVLFYLFVHLSWKVELYAEGPDRRTDGLLPGAPVVNLNETPRGLARQEVFEAQCKATTRPRSPTRKKVTK
jgi:hypothetical protein